MGNTANKYLCLFFMIILFAGCSSPTNNKDFIISVIDQKIDSVAAKKEIKQLDKSLMQNPGSRDLLIKKGLCLIVCKDLVKAKSIFANIILTDSGNVEALTGLSLVNEEEGKISANEILAGNIIKKAPDNGIGYYLRAGLGKNPDRSLSDLDKSLKLTPSLSSAYLRKAVIYAFAKDSIIKAIQLADSAIAMNPGNNDFYFMRSIFNETIQNYKGMAEDYTQMINLNETNRLYDLSKRGLIYEKLNEPEKAKKDYDEITKNDSVFGKYCYAGLYYNQKEYNSAYYIIKNLLDNGIYSGYRFLDDPDGRFQGINDNKKFKELLNKDMLPK